MAETKYCYYHGRTVGIVARCKNVLALDSPPPLRRQMFKCSCGHAATVCSNRSPSCARYGSWNGLQQTEGGCVLSSMPPHSRQECADVQRAQLEGQQKRCTSMQSPSGCCGATRMDSCDPSGFRPDRKACKEPWHDDLTTAHEMAHIPAGAMGGVHVARGYKACGMGRYRTGWRAWKRKLRKWSKYQADVLCPCNDSHGPKES